LKCVLTPDVDCKFYIEDDLLGVIDNNLPVGVFPWPSIFTLVVDNLSAAKIYYLTILHTDPADLRS